MCGGHRCSWERLWNILLSSLWEKKSDTEIKSWPQWNSNRVPLDPKSQCFQLSHEALDMFSGLKRLFVFFGFFFFYMDLWTIYQNVLHLIPHGNAREGCTKRASTREIMAARAKLFYRYDTYTRRFYRYETVTRELFDLLRLSSELKTKKDRLYVLDNSVKNFGLRIYREINLA